MNTAERMKAIEQVYDEKQNEFYEPDWLDKSTDWLNNYIDKLASKFRTDSGIQNYKGAVDVYTHLAEIGEIPKEDLQMHLDTEKEYFNRKETE